MTIQAETIQRNLNGKNYNCFVTFKLFCQNIKNYFVDSDKCIGKRKNCKTDI